MSFPILSVKRAIVIAIAMAVLPSCNREHDPVSEHLKDLFPLNEGGTRIYHVVDTSYASISFVDAKTYYKMEAVNGQETDLKGRPVSKLWVYISPDTLGTLESPQYDWEFETLWTTTIDQGYAERIEGNARYLVLKLPAYESSSWNGNLYNSGEVQTYHYLNLDTTVNILGRSFEHCVYVEQVPFRQPVAEPGGAFFLIEHAYEIYAPGIGKVERYSKYYVEQGGVPVETSRIYHERIVDYNF